MGSLSMRSMAAFAALATMVAAMLSPVATERAMACPFCTAQALTLTEEIDTSTVAVLATLTKVPKNNEQPIDPSAALEPCEFKIDQVVKGADVIAGGNVVRTLYLGQAAIGSKFLITAIPSEQAKIIWAAPIALPERGPEYLAKVLKLPKEGPERLIFFQDYIQDKDELLARDAYDEIAKLPYDVIVKAKDKLRHDDFVEWIQDPDTTASKRRMFFSLLSVCGTKEDVPMLERMIRSTERRDRSGLDSMLNCYMALLGEDAMPLIEELFLKDPKVDYTDRYSAIMAIRFQGTEGKAVPRERLIEALRLNLDHPKVADLVVMDLARWKDWDSMERLVEMFKKSGDETIFIREPVINYLRICQGKEAKKHLEDLAKIDPIAYQRALSMMPLPAAVPTKDEGKDDKAAASSDTAKPDAKPKNEAGGDKKTDDVKPTSQAPAKDAGDAATSQRLSQRRAQLRPRTANRPTIAVAGMEAERDDSEITPATRDPREVQAAATGSPGTIAVAVVMVVAALCGAVVIVRR